jgi:hypothetical protein
MEQIQKRIWQLVSSTAKSIDDQHAPFAHIRPINQLIFALTCRMYFVL